jgi:hypothetical protein
MIAPSILFYYWQESDGKINFWPTLVIIMFFFSGVLNLFDDDYVLKYVIIVNFFSYSIILSFIIRSLLEFKFKYLDNINLIYIILTFLFLCSLLYVSLFLVFDTNHQLYGMISVYAFELLLMGVLNSIACTVNFNKCNKYLMITIICYIMCDLFYIIYYYYYDFVLFRYFSILSNIISFYFLVNFFLCRNVLHKHEVEQL